MACLPGHMQVNAQTTRMDSSPDQKRFNDALARVEIESFLTQVSGILDWMRSHSIASILVDPPYVDAVADANHYSALVRGLRKVAQRQNNPLVLR